MADSSNSSSQYPRQRFNRPQHVVDSDDKGHSDAPVRQRPSIPPRRTMAPAHGEPEASQPSEKNVSGEGNEDVEELTSDLIDEEDNVKENGDEYEPEDESPQRQPQPSRKRKTLQPGTRKASQADIDSPSTSELEPAAKRTRTALPTPSTQAPQRKKMFGGLDLPTDEESDSVCDFLDPTAIHETTGDPVKGVYWDRSLTQLANFEEKLRQYKVNSHSVECPMSFLETSVDSMFHVQVPDNQKVYTFEILRQRKKAHLPKLREGAAISRGAAHRYRMLGHHNSKYDVNMLLGQNNHIRNDEIIVPQIFEYVENFYNNYARADAAPS